MVRDFASAALSNAQFRVGKNADPESLRVIRALFVRLGEKHCLIGVVENPDGETHLPIIVAEGNKFEFFCGGESPKELSQLLHEHELPPPAYCWRKEQRGGRSTGCKHALALLKAIEEGLAPEVITPSSSSQQPPEELEERLWTLRFRANLLLVGEAGSGKTHLAFTLARRAKEEERAAIIFVQGSPAVEAPDLLGRYIKVGEEIRWIDGPLSKAFKLARKGKKVVLIIDELPRIPAREQGILVSSLFPVKGKKREWYILTNLLNGEEIWCPSSNLWAIATGNVGLGYSYSVISDQALQERFLTFHVPTTLSKLEKVLKPLIASKGWDVERLLPSLLKLREVGEELTQRGELSAPPSLRVLKRAVELAQREEDLPWLLVHSFPASSPEEQEVWKEVVRKALSP